MLRHISFLSIQDWGSRAKSRRQGGDGQVEIEVTQAYFLRVTWPCRLPPPHAFSFLHQNPQVSAPLAGGWGWGQGTPTSVAHPTFSGSSWVIGGQREL